MRVVGLHRNNILDPCRPFIRVKGSRNNDGDYYLRNDREEREESQECDDKYLGVGCFYRKAGMVHRYLIFRALRVSGERESEESWEGGGHGYCFERDRDCNCKCAGKDCNSKKCSSPRPHPKNGKWDRDPKTKVCRKGECSKGTRFEVKCDDGYEIEEKFVSNKKSLDNFFSNSILQEIKCEDGEWKKTSGGPSENPIKEAKEVCKPKKCKKPDDPDGGKWNCTPGCDNDK